MVKDFCEKKNLNSLNFKVIFFLLPNHSRLFLVFVITLNNALIKLRQEKNFFRVLKNRLNAHLYEY